MRGSVCANVMEDYQEVNIGGSSDAPAPSGCVWGNVPRACEGVWGRRLIAGEFARAKADRDPRLLGLRSHWGAMDSEHSEAVRGCDEGAGNTRTANWEGWREGRVDKAVIICFHSNPIITWV